MSASPPEYVTRSFYDFTRQWKTQTQEQTKFKTYSEYASVISRLWVRTPEYMLRIRFPIHDSSNGIPTRRLFEIREKEGLNGDAVLIDISGIGGVTCKWFCPEMLESKKDALSWSIAR
ncbi:hypothetical protein B0T26DRAFT_677838 [Lasiosphaeria miniovina]|uniref:Uncharacterized protein n=1 Tax=Lasiosphaeria miniovina TaxID=1954250 RepID=A0AA40ACU3_9PEZI|nr:uncharacterized protein B0T26DRAFT_677838 [Lasiosphaeria miniovina]KAK0713513.1 hypothetical protein B0T26DRAFT_677838 [Lasiosphaeria miniovina]